MDTKEYLVEIAFLNTPKDTNIISKYQIESTCTNSTLSKDKKYAIKKYKLNSAYKVIQLQIDIKNKKIPAYLFSIECGTKILINNLQEKSELFDSDATNHYPTDDGYVMEDYSSSED